MSDRELRQRILDAAEACLLERGPSARVHGLIAERAGVSRPTVYKYFGDQQAVTEALLEREVDRYFDTVGPEIDHASDKRAQFIDTVVFTVVYAREHALLQTLLRAQPDVVLPWFTTQAEVMLRSGIAAMSAALRPDRAEHQTDDELEVLIEWGIRLVVSLITTPSVVRELQTADDLRRYVGSLLEIGRDRSQLSNL